MMAIFSLHVQKYLIFGPSYRAGAFLAAQAHFPHTSALVSASAAPSVKDRLVQLSQVAIIRYFFAASVANLIAIVVYTVFRDYLLPADLHLFQFGSIATGDTEFVSVTIMFIVGVIINFILTRWLVFPNGQSHVRTQFIKYVAVALVAFFCNLNLIPWLRDVIPGLVPLPVELVSPVVAGVSILAVSLISFTLHRVFTFK